eukprot:gene876-100_t
MAMFLSKFVALTVGAVYANLRINVEAPVRQRSAKPSAPKHESGKTGASEGDNLQLRR